ncbi:sll1863 family stress response protein [Desulfonatronum parangueonense]
MNNKNTKNEYILDMQRRIDELYGYIVQLRTKLSISNPEKKYEYNKQLESLREERDELEKKVAAMQAADESSWEKLKDGFERSWESFNESYASLKLKFTHDSEKERDQDHERRES